MTGTMARFLLTILLANTIVFAIPIQNTWKKEVESVRPQGELLGFAYAKFTPHGEWDINLKDKDDYPVRKLILPSPHVKTENLVLLPIFDTPEKIPEGHWVCGVYSAVWKDPDVWKKLKSKLIYDDTPPPPYSPTQHPPQQPPQKSPQRLPQGLPHGLPPPYSLGSASPHNPHDKRGFLTGFFTRKPKVRPAPPPIPFSIQNKQIVLTISKGYLPLGKAKYNPKIEQNRYRLQARCLPPSKTDEFLESKDRNGANWVAWGVNGLPDEYVKHQVEMVTGRMHPGSQTEYPPHQHQHQH